MRITRRCRAVAVMLSEAANERLSEPRDDLLAFTARWRQRMRQTGLPLLEDGELEALRNPAQRPVPDIA